MPQPIIANDNSNIDYVRRIRFGWARASSACGAGLVYLSVYALWIADALTTYQRARNRDSFFFANEAAFQAFMGGKKTAKADAATRLEPSITSTVTNAGK